MTHGSQAPPYDGNSITGARADPVEDSPGNQEHKGIGNLERKDDI